MKNGVLASLCTVDAFCRVSWTVCLLQSHSEELIEFLLLLCNMTVFLFLLHVCLGFVALKNNIFLKTILVTDTSTEHFTIMAFSPILNTCSLTWTKFNLRYSEDRLIGLSQRWLSWQDEVDPHSLWTIATQHSVTRGHNGCFYNVNVDSKEAQWKWWKSTHGTVKHRTARGEHFPFIVI